VLNKGTLSVVWGTSLFGAHGKSWIKLPCILPPNHLIYPELWALIAAIFSKIHFCRQFFDPGQTKSRPRNFTQFYSRRHFCFRAQATFRIYTDHWNARKHAYFTFSSSRSLHSHSNRIALGTPYIRLAHASSTKTLNAHELTTRLPTHPSNPSNSNQPNVFGTDIRYICYTLEF